MRAKNMIMIHYLSTSEISSFDMNHLFELEGCDVNDRITCVLHAKSGRVYLDFSSTLNPKNFIRHHVFAHQS